MPPRGKPTSSHSSRPSSSHSSRPSRPSSSHSSRPSSHHSHSGGYSSHSGHRSPPPHRYGGYGGPPPPHRSNYRPYRRSYGSGYSSAPIGCGCGGCGTTLTVMLIVAVILGIAIYFVSLKEQEQAYQSGSRPQQSISTQAPESHDPIFIAPLNRMAEWSTEYDCYYDKITDCYFFENTEVDPPIWQYWFESVSADYGDYGWMEWDPEEKRWYVQTGEYNWEVLPKEKNSAILWHFD